MTDDTIELTDRQREAVERPADSRTLVVAPAGTGKTEVLVARIAYLVHEARLSPGREILVLSFSRAAVGEIARRVRSGPGNVAYTRAVTFDSFATGLLAATQSDSSWNTLGYDGRIAAAVDAILTSPHVADFLAEIKHVLVDEIQDLVGIRRDLVEGVLNKVDGGFTMLGDPAQAIYDWQEDDSTSQTSEPITIWMGYRFEYSTIHLDQNFRAQSDRAQSVIPLGDHLVQDPFEPSTATHAINSFLRQLPHLGSLDQAAVALRNREPTTAILCRNNGQSLVVSKELNQRHIDHRLQRRAVDRAVAPWIGALFGRTTATSMSRSGFERRHGELSDRLETPSVDEAWRLLKRLDRGDPTTLDLGRVAERIRIGAISDELTPTPNSPIVVSTIHRAKGLEFDRVLLIEPHESDLAGDDLVGELRVVYVGLSRARRDLFVLSAPDTDFLHHRGALDRWVLGGWKRWHRRGIEIRGTDVHSGHPAGGWLIDANNAAESQDYLIHNVDPGDVVELELFKASSFGSPRAFYTVIHDGWAIGLTSEGFARDLYEVLKVNSEWEVRWPQAITDVRIESLDTVAGTAAAGTNAGLGPSGIWLRPRIVGLGSFQWKDATA